MICWEIDWRSPYEAFAPLAGQPFAHLLHGGDRSSSAEWSIIAAFPSETFIAAPDQSPEEYLGTLQAVINDRRITDRSDPAGTPFMSGFIGYVGYEALAPLEPTLRLPPSPFALPDIAFGSYDAVAIFSRRTKNAFITGRDEKACLKLKAAIGKDALPPILMPHFRALRSNFTRPDYESAVSRVIEAILDGDYYQTNIAQQLTCTADGTVSPFELFRRLAENSDASFGSLLQFDSGAIVSNSPERFFCLSRSGKKRWRIITEPIKGTRPRGKSDAEDIALREALINDPKDRAENIMIADLMRNDLSKICQDGSIREEAICELLSLARVHHLVSRISGELREGVSIPDTFKALFPCGSITGAPKIEAMNAIAHIEGVGRGPYCGAIGYIDDCGAADFSVAIRTIMVTQDNTLLTIPVGGGITLRSRPDEEYQETLVKAQGAFSTISKTYEDLE